MTDQQMINITYFIDAIPFDAHINRYSNTVNEQEEMG